VHHEGRPAPSRDAGDLHLESVQRGLISPRFVDERPRARLADPLVEVQAERDGVLRAEIELTEGRLIVGAEARAAREQDEPENPQRILLWPTLRALPGRRESPPRHARRSRASRDVPRPARPARRRWHSPRRPARAWSRPRRRRAGRADGTSTAPR